jgi:hypothetical protein
LSRNVGLDDQYALPRLPARLSFVKELPHEQAGTGARGADPPSLDIATTTGSHVIADRAREVRYQGAELFDFYGAMVVHDLSSRVRLLARTSCENHDSSTPYSSDISFRIRFGGPDRPKVPNQTHFKIGVRGTHDSTTRHLSRLA